MLFLIVTCFVVVCDLLLGLVAFFKNPKSASNILFFILSIILALWTVTNYFSLQPTPPEIILFWIRAVMFVTGAMFAVLYLLTDTFPKNNMNIKGISLVLIIGFVFLTQFLSTTDLVFQRVEVSNGNVNPVPGLGIAVVAVNFVGFLLLTFITLYRKNKTSIGLEQIRLKYLILGIASTFILAIITNFIFVVILKLTSFVALGPLFALNMIGFIAYAIIKHRFLDIRLVVARSVSYFLLLLVAGTFYAGGLFLTGTFFTKQSSSSTNLIISTILALIIAFSFQTFLQFFQKLTDRIFYQGRYESHQLLSTLAHIMSVNIELKPLATLILQTLISEMRITKGAFILLEKDLPTQFFNVGFSNELELFYDKIAPLLNIHEIAVFDELEEGPLKMEMRNQGISIAKVLHPKEAIIGYLVLGEKASGEMYSEQDLKVLEILAPEVTVAIQNAEAFDQIQKFNITLSQEVKKATSDLQQANTKLKNLDQLKDDFVSIASHELRTPMTAIKSYLWMAINRPDVKLSKKMTKYLSRAYISTERLINLVNDMLNVSRIESGRIEIKPCCFDLLVLVEEVLSEVKAKADEKMVHLEITKGSSPQVFADPDKVHQVLLNLIGNSLKFTPTSGTVTVSLLSDGQMVDVAVKDTGVGISKDDLARLFQKFGRLDNSYVAAATVGGTGLGLYISKSLVELMKGKIWASSEGLGKGSTFTFSLPVATSEVLSQTEKYTTKVVGEAKGLEPVAI